MAQFSIGQFDFISLSRPPSVAKRRLVREVRPGAAGVAFWGAGKQAGPFQLVSVRDAQDCSEATTIVAAYQQLVGGNPVPFFWCGSYHSDVIVHDVEPIDRGIYQTLLGIGGIRGTSNGMAHCQWVLEYVEFAEQEQ